MSEMELPKVLPPSIPKIASYIRYHCLWVAEVFDHVTRHTWGTAPSSPSSVTFSHITYYYHPAQSLTYPQT